MLFRLFIGGVRVREYAILEKLHYALQALVQCSGAVRSEAAMITCYLIHSFIPSG